MRDNVRATFLTDQEECNCILTFFTVFFLIDFLHFSLLLFLELYHSFRVYEYGNGDPQEFYDPSVPSRFNNILTISGQRFHVYEFTTHDISYMLEESYLPLYLIYVLPRTAFSDAAKQPKQRFYLCYRCPYLTFCITSAGCTHPTHRTQHPVLQQPLFDCTAPLSSLKAGTFLFFFFLFQVYDFRIQQFPAEFKQVRNIHAKSYENTVDSIDWNKNCRKPWPGSSVG